jgi:hypothetical protein
MTIAKTKFEYFHARLGLMENAFLAKRECWWLQLRETSSRTQTWERAPEMGVWFLSEIELERSDGLLLTESWEELQMILLCNAVRKEICWVGRACGWAQGERVNSHELGASLWDRDEDDVLASSEQRVEMMNSRWLSCVMQWERRSVELDVFVDEHRWTWS